MSRSARKSKLLRSGVIGFVAGLATLGVVAHGSPVHAVVVGAVPADLPVVGALVAPDAPQQQHRSSAIGLRLSAP